VAFVGIKLSDEQKLLWVEAADGDGCSLSEWIKRACARQLQGRPPSGDVPLVLEVPEESFNDIRLLSSVDQPREFEEIPPSVVKPSLDAFGPVVDTGPVVGKISRPVHNADPKDKAAMEHAKGPKKKVARKNMCEHRVPAGSFFKR